MIIYHVQDKDRLPFRVEFISPMEVRLYIQHFKRSIREKKTVYKIKPRKEWFGLDRVFIGRSSYYNTGCFYGPQYDGNSILLKTSKDNNYVYIGYHVIRFTSLAPIKSFASPVGTDFTPYPYAIDEENNFYLFAENVILTQVPKDVDDVYEWYYDRVCITPIMTVNTNNESREDILAFYHGDRRYDLRFTPNPVETFRYWTITQKKQMFIITKDSYPHKEELMLPKFIKIMTDYGEKHGFRRLKYKAIVKESRHSIGRRK